MKVESPSQPLLVGTISSLEFLSGYADTAAQKRVADLVEARLDLFEGVDLGRSPELSLAACQRVESSGTPTLVTIRLQREGGRWTAGDEARLGLFERAIAVASWVDVEASSAIAAAVTRLAHGSGRRAVVSYHNFQETPPLPELQRIAERCRAAGADVVKLAVLVNAAQDRDALVELLRQSPGENLCVVGMGADAASLRVLFPTLGSVFAYAYLDQPAAPGQLSATEMAARLRATCPAFAERHAKRTEGAADRTETTERK